MAILICTLRQCLPILGKFIYWCAGIALRACPTTVKFYSMSLFHVQRIKYCLSYPKGCLNHTHRSLTKLVPGIFWQSHFFIQAEEIVQGRRMNIIHGIHIQTASSLFVVSEMKMSSNSQSMPETDGIMQLAFKAAALAAAADAADYTCAAVDCCKRPTLC